MRRRPPQELMEYRNQQLMDDLNEFCISLKIWLYPEHCGENRERLQRRYGKPTVADMDQLLFRLIEELQKDARPMRRY